jgi:hypothetical protein
MGRSGEWAIVDIRRDAKVTATEALSIAALNPMTGTVVLPRDGLVTPVPTQVIHHVGAVDADGNLTFPQLGQLAVLAQPLREGRRPYQLRIDRKGRSKFWRPFQRDYVVDPRNPAALWVYDGTQREGKTAPDLGPFGAAEEPTIVLGVPGQPVPPGVANVSWEQFIEARPVGDEPRRLVVHGPALSEPTELLGGVNAERVGAAVVLVWAARSANDVVKHRVAAAQVADDGAPVVYVAPGFGDDEFVFALDQVLTRLPDDRNAAGDPKGPVRLMVPPDRADQAWATRLRARYSAIEVTVFSHDEAAAAAAGGHVSAERVQEYERLETELQARVAENRSKMLVRQTRARGRYRARRASLGEPTEAGGGGEGVYTVLRATFGPQLQSLFDKGAAPLEGHAAVGMTPASYRDAWMRCRSWLRW